MSLHSRNHLLENCLFGYGCTARYAPAAGRSAGLRSANLLLWPGAPTRTKQRRGASLDALARFRARRAVSAATGALLDIISHRLKALPPDPAAQFVWPVCWANCLDSPYSASRSTPEIIDVVDASLGLASTCARSVGGNCRLVRCKNRACSTRD